MIGLDGNVIIRTLRRMGLCVQPTEPRFYNLRGCANIRNLEREWKIFYISLDSLISYTALRKNPAAVQHLTECQTLKQGTFRLKYLPLFYCVHILFEFRFTFSCNSLDSYSNFFYILASLIIWRWAVALD